MMDEMKPREPDLEQRIMGLDDNAMSDYVNDTRLQLHICLESVCFNIVRMTFLKKPDISGKALKEAEEGYNRYFQSLKGQTNLSLDDITLFVNEEITKQQEFYRRLNDLCVRFKGFGCNLEVLSPENVFCEPAWRTEFTVGTTVQADPATYLYALPTAQAETMYYAALTQDLVAADIVSINDDYILFLPAGQDTTDSFIEACKDLFDERKDITGDIPGTWQAIKGDGYVLIDEEGTVAEEEIQNLRDSYNVTAVVTANSSNFTATIHCKQSKVLERVKREIGRN